MNRPAFWGVGMITDRDVDAMASEHEARMLVAKYGDFYEHGEFAPDFDDFDDRDFVDFDDRDKED